jgi:enoyl-CoA hydratase/carnithine racemase
MSEGFRLERDGHVATLTLDRVAQHNAFDIPTAEGLHQAWLEIKADPQIRCVIVTGAGERAFCTGMDVTAIAAGESQHTAELPRREAPWSKLTAVQNRVWKPVITAVNGMCVGGGFHFVVDSDLVIAAEHATFFDTHVKVGAVGALEPVTLARRIGLEATLRLALLGGSERMSAAEALRVGLVGEVVPADQLMPRARALAEMIASHSPAALQRTKRAVWESLDLGLEPGLDHAWKLVQEHNDHPDLQEGGMAFVEKRAPAWKPHSED